ncbi:MAG: hypothetical protein ACE5G8_10660, partial [Anaerolineae bacterium]
MKFNGVLRRLVWANILIAGSAAGWVVVALHALGLAFDGALAGLAFFLTLAFYTRDRLDMQEHSADRLAMPQRTAWVRRNEKHLRRVVWGGFACAVLLAAFRPGAMLPLLAGLGFALSYTRRWLPWRGERRGWKHLPGLKMP